MPGQVRARGSAGPPHLDEWGGEYEPELARLDMDIKIKAWEREQV